MKSTTARASFLAALSLSRDPFAWTSAEQELQASIYGADPERFPSGAIPIFFEYFTSPPIPIPEGRTPLGVLRDPGLACIYGERGSGKTMLRLVLEAYIRLFPENTLVISHPLREEDPQTLARDMAIDLFIQLMEQERWSAFLSPEAEAPLLYTLLPAAPAIARVITRFLRDPAPEHPMGDALRWPALGRPVVRPLHLSHEARLFLESLRLRMEALEASCPPPPDPKIGFEAARRAGFQRILILIDDVDFGDRTPEAIEARLQPLLEHLPAWHESGIDPKLFLPVSIRDRIAGRIAVRPYLEATLEWDEEALRRLLIQRFRAAGSRRISLEDRAGPGLRGQLDMLILRSARGSPRRLLQIVSALLDAHLARDPQDPLFRPEDWERMRREWPYEPPPPDPLEVLTSAI
ncbi:hypothetical protein [Thermoflexus hugenholtzii]